MTRPVATGRTKADLHFKPEDRPCYTQRIPADEVTLDLPMPPSANRLFGMVRGRRMKTPAYRSWRDHAALVGSLQKPGRLVRRCDVVIHLPPFKGDTDNRTKPLLDAAKEIGVIADDGEKWVRHVYARREDEGETARLVFTAIADATPSPEAA